MYDALEVVVPHEVVAYVHVTCFARCGRVLCDVDAGFVVFMDLDW